MSGIFERLAHIARTQVYDLLDRYFPEGSAATSPKPGHETWDTYTAHDDFDSTPPFEPPPRSSSGLPYSQELAEHYRVLDLPFGTPIEQVSRQWKTYLKKCHPDLHAHDPAQQAQATELTQQLNNAYSKIQRAWAAYQR